MKSVMTWPVQCELMPSAYPMVGSGHGDETTAWARMGLHDFYSQTFSHVFRTRQTKFWLKVGTVLHPDKKSASTWMCSYMYRSVKWVHKNSRPTWFKVDAKFCESIVYTSLYIYIYHCKNEVLTTAVTTVVWLSLLCNAVLEKDSCSGSWYIYLNKLY